MRASTDPLQFEIRGLNEVVSRLHALEKNQARAVLRKATRAGAKAFLGPIKAATPVRTGLLRRAVKVRAMKRTRKRFIGTAVTLGAGFFKGPTFYGAFLEFGRKTGKRGSSNRRQIPGRHFMERAGQRAMGSAFTALVQTAQVEFEAALGKKT